MKTFQITRPDETIREALTDKINNLTKPKGSLGTLEELALQIGLIPQTLTPELRHPQNIIFAADHGIVDEGVSLSPKEITWQQISNFLHGGAGVNFLCRQHGFELKIVDAGVDYDLPYEKGIINMKVRKSSRNYLYEAAMTEEEKSGNLIKKLCRMVEVLEIPASLSVYGVSRDDLDVLVDAGMQVQRLLVNNRRTVTEEDARKLYLEVL